MSRTCTEPRRAAMDEQICRAAMSSKYEEVQQLLAGGWSKDAKCSAALFQEVDSSALPVGGGRGVALFQLAQPRGRQQGPLPTRQQGQAQGGAVATAIFLAARKGHVGVVRLLAEAGANFSTHDSRETGEQRTVLIAAAQSGNLECVQFLLERGGSDVAAADAQGRTALDHTQQCQMDIDGHQGFHHRHQQQQQQQQMRRQDPRDRRARRQAPR